MLRRHLKAVTRPKARFLVVPVLFRDNVRELRVWAFITEACVFVRVERVVRLTPKGRQNAHRVLDRVRNAPSLGQTSLCHCLVLELWIT
jgi:hypothetical protein